MPVSNPLGHVGDGAERKSDARFRSFAERYVIARAENFRVGHEIEDGHAALLAARTIYKMAKEVGKTIDPEAGS